MRATPDMIERAAQWAALLDSNAMSREDRAACETWCAEHPLHQQILDRMRAFDDRLKAAGGLEQSTLRHLLQRRSSGRRRVKGILPVIAVFAVAAAAGIQTNFVRDYFPDHRTAVGELRDVVLSDGSKLTLDTDGAVRVDMEDDQREVRLIRGKILASVSKDSSRPFAVVTRDGTVTALGTAFTVHRRNDDTIVTVIESQVHVCPGKAARDDDRCRTLSPGEQARLTSTSVTRLANVEPDQAALWSSGWLEADDQDVTEVLAELSRYHRQPIYFDPVELRGLKVTGSFPFRDAERALDGIARTAELDLRRSADGTVRVTRRH